MRVPVFLRALSVCPSVFRLYVPRSPVRKRVWAAYLISYRIAKDIE